MKALLALMLVGSIAAAHADLNLSPRPPLAAPSNPTNPMLEVKPKPKHRHTGKRSGVRVDGVGNRYGGGGHVRAPVATF
jgi:hypothetical protein